MTALATLLVLAHFHIIGLAIVFLIASYLFVLLVCVAGALLQFVLKPVVFFSLAVLLFLIGMFNAGPATVLAAMNGGMAAAIAMLTAIVGFILWSTRSHRGPRNPAATPCR